MEWIREKFGTVVISGIIGFIALIFVVSGVFTPKATRGLGEGAVAGTVNGEPISLAEFNRALNQRTEYMKAIFGGRQLTDEQLKAFRIREGVFQELVRRKVMIQEAQRRGMVPSDEEIREKIGEIPAFQNNGKFDVATYKQVLEANSYTPGGFERLMREDLSMDQWQRYFHDQIHVAEDEARQQFNATENKRELRYVLLTPELARKDVQVQPDEISKFLADASKQSLAKAQYDMRKDSQYKGKSFDQVKGEIAKDILAGEKSDQVRKNLDAMSQHVLSVMTGDKSSDAKVNALLKPYGAKVQTTGWISRMNPRIPGMGESPELLKDAFASKSPINPADGGKPKKYTDARGVVVAVISATQKPDPSQFESKRPEIFQQISERKERQLFESWTKKLVEKAKIEPNPSVLGEES